jgi:hypothetical protein
MQFNTYTVRASFPPCNASRHGDAQRLTDFERAGASAGGVGQGTASAKGRVMPRAYGGRERGINDPNVRPVNSNHSRDRYARHHLPAQRNLARRRLWGDADTVPTTVPTTERIETAFVYPDGTKGTDLYLSVTSRDTVPPNPYQR